MNDACRERVAAIVASAVIVAAWVALTDATGKTYHLAPLLAAAAPGAVLRGRPRVRRPALVIGAIAVAVGWLLIVAWRIAPTATIVHGQPGGVAGEVVAFAALGLAIGSRPRPGVARGSHPPPALASGSRGAIRRGGRVARGGALGWLRRGVCGR